MSKVSRGKLLAGASHGYGVAGYGAGWGYGKGYGIGYGVGDGYGRGFGRSAGNGCGTGDGYVKFPIFEVVNEEGKSK
jgi:hypothetical protein